MAVKLSQSAYDHAKRLIDEGKAVRDERDDWSEHQPSAEEENRFIEAHGWREYGHWPPGAGRRREPRDEGALQVPLR
jgi:hypothetical protein